MNLTNRIYIGVHVALTLLVCIRWQHVGRAPLYLLWNAVAIAAIRRASTSDCCVRMMA